MNNARLFVGNIMHKESIVEKNVMFFQYKFDSYVKYDYVTKSNDIYVINFKEKDIVTFGTTKNDRLYIDIDSLVPYVENKKKRSLRKSRKINKVASL